MEENLKKFNSPSFRIKISLQTNDKNKQPLQTDIFLVLSNSNVLHVLHNTFAH